MENKENTTKIAMEQKAPQRKRFKPYLKFIIIGLFVLAGVILLASGVNSHSIEEFASDINPAKQSCKEIVENGHFEKYPKKSIKEGFKGFFGNPKWKYFYSTDGKDIVEFSGKCEYEKQPVTAKIQFIVNKEAGTFKLGSLSFNDVPQSLLIEAGVISKIFDPSDTSEKTEDTQNSQSQTANTDETSSSNANNSTPSKDVTYENYANSRFGFSIDYPSSLSNRNTSDNGDGIILTNEAGDAKLTVSGSNNALNSTAQSAYNDAISNNTNNISYKVQSGNWFILSWTEGNKIVYEKEVVGTGSMNTFILEYPINQKDMYAPIVERLNKSFKTPSLGEAH